MGYRPCIIWLPCTWGGIPLLLIKADPVVSLSMIHGAWLSLGRIGSSLRARRARVETSVFDFGTHVLKHPTLGFFWRNVYPNCNIVCNSLECNLTRRYFDCAALAQPCSRVLGPESCRFARAVNDLTTERLWGDCSTPIQDELGQCFNRCKGTVIWRCVACMFSQALRNTTCCNSTSLQLASLASSFTPFFNLFHREPNARRELGIFCVVQHSPEAQQRYLQAAVADYDLFKPSSLQDIVACFFFSGRIAERWDFSWTKLCSGKIIWNMIWNLFWLGWNNLWLRKW